MRKLWVRKKHLRYLGWYPNNWIRRDTLSWLMNASTNNIEADSSICVIKNNVITSLSSTECLSYILAELILFWCQHILLYFLVGMCVYVSTCVGLLNSFKYNNCTCYWNLVTLKPNNSLIIESLQMCHLKRVD